MIRLSKRNWWVRMAYTTRESWAIPERTNICTLFWRGLLTLSVEIAIAAGVGFALSWFGVALVNDWRGFLQAMWELSMAVAFIVSISLIIWLIVSAVYGAQRVVNALSQTVPAEAFKSWKERHCALVRIED